MTTALVLGGGHTLIADVAAYRGDFDLVVACNDAGWWWPGPLRAWVTLHPQNFNNLKHRWLGRREENGYEPAQELVSHDDRKWKGKPSGMTISHWAFTDDEKEGSGSSGLFAAKFALIDLQADDVVLCGVPMTIEPHFFKDRGGADDWKSAQGFRNQWLKLPEAYKSRMKSMSGWSREFLGAPVGQEKETTCTSW